MWLLDCLKDTEKEALRLSLPETCHVSESIGGMLVAEVRDRPEKPLAESFSCACFSFGMHNRRKVAKDMGVVVAPSVWSKALFAHSGGARGSVDLEVHE